MKLGIAGPRSEHSPGTFSGLAAQVRARRAAVGREPCYSAPRASPLPMDPHLEKTRAYYDDFAARYERHRDQGTYHALVDELEVDLVARYGAKKDVLECGCGTGLLLERIARFAGNAKGLDLSPGMLEKARARGLDVREGSVTRLPFDDASFDVACSFKVLAHVPDIHGALAEMARVTRSGGVVIAEFYNPLSFRGLAKRLGPAGRVSATRRESDVFTRFDAPWSVRSLAPRGTRFEAARGVRIVTPAAAFMRVPGLRGVLRSLERRLADGPASIFGGFYVAVFRKE
jgi:ubiquinone/menaquinone biosynthesis C-methylase UbiE